MSIEAVSWVLKLEIARSSEKFVMVCLANYADKSGICYPSVQTLCRDTGQDRKTVTCNLKRLCEKGLLRDTGRRIGATGRVTVYQLVGMPFASAVHYTFKVTNLETGEFHIGSRSFYGDPELDVYRGSSKWVMDMLGRGIALHREVLHVFDNLPAAQTAELGLFREASGNPLCRNEQAPRNSPRDLQESYSGNAPQNDGPSNSPKNGTIANTSVFPANTPVFPPNTPVFGRKQAQKRCIEPSEEPSEESSSKPTKEKFAKRTSALVSASVTIELPDWLPEPTWKDWMNHRALVKAPLTQRSAELCLDKLAKMREEGHDPVAAIEQSVLSGKWTDLYPPRKQSFDPMNLTAFDDQSRPAKFNAGVYVNSGAAYAHIRAPKFDPTAYVNSGVAYPNHAPSSDMADPLTIDGQFIERHWQL